MRDGQTKQGSYFDVAKSWRSLLRFDETVRGPRVYSYSIRFAAYAVHCVHRFIPSVLFYFPKKLIPPICRIAHIGVLNVESFRFTAMFLRGGGDDRGKKNKISANKSIHCFHLAEACAQSHRREHSISVATDLSNFRMPNISNSRCAATWRQTVTR